MKVAREAVHRVEDGTELTLADLGLLVAHLQTTGEAPPHARVLLRNDQIRLDWTTEQQSAEELKAEQERVRAEREAARAATAEALPADDVAEVAAEPADLGIVRGRRGRASSDA